MPLNRKSRSEERAGVASTALDKAKYYLGKACKYGHESGGAGLNRRFVSDRTCVECKTLKNQRRSQRDERDRYLSRVYGITQDQYEMLSESQGGVCAICGEPPIAGENLAVDHCHKGGHVRGLLCRSCNSALGLMKDDARIANKAVEYLLRF